MKKIDYKEQIKSPKWQKKRLEILNRDNFTCQMCGDTNSTLHVHHTIYIPGKNIWDYNDLQLITLCDKCHSKEHYSEEYDMVISNAITEARKIGLTRFELCMILRWLYLGYEEVLLDREIKEVSDFVTNSTCNQGEFPIQLEKLKRLYVRRKSIKNNIKNGTH